MQPGPRGNRAILRIVFSVTLTGLPAVALGGPPAHIEPGPVVEAVRYVDGKVVKLQTQTVTRPFCGSAPNAITVEQLGEIARRAAARAAAQQPAVAAAQVLGGPAKFDLVYNIVGTLPAGAEEALAEVERYLEAQFDDPITVTVNFQFASLPPGVLGSTSSSYVNSVPWPDVRTGLQNGMDFSDSIQGFLPPDATIPVRYDGNSATVTNENRVFVTRANYNATIGAVGGSAASITFSSNFPWDYDPTNGITGGTWCFRSVIAHETGHALGFVSGVDFRTNDIETLDVYRFQRSDGTGDYNPDTLAEFQTTARMIDQNAPGTNDDVNSDLISVEYQMSDASPSQASHFHDQNPPIGVMDPTIGSGQTFHPNLYRTSDADMFDAIGYDYPHANTICILADELACNDVRHFDNTVLTGSPNPAFGCGSGGAHTGTAWFTFVATADSAHISTCGSPGANSTWAVYSGTCGSLTEIACSEDGGCGGGSNSAQCVSGLTPGNTYYLQLAANSAATKGVYTITIECSCDGACCVPPPEICATEKEDECAARGGTFFGGGSACPVNPIDRAELCATLNPVFSQPATGNQEDLASNVDWSDVIPNDMVVDDFRADGRPIRAVRWWGSVLDDSVSPDGWLVSFHQPKGSGDPAGEALGVYFCEAAAVSSTATALLACDAETVIDYSADLSDCCLVHSSVDPRSSETPAEPDGFGGESCVDYEIGVGAVVGQTFDAGTCTASATAVTAAGAYWGWHTSVIEAATGTALTGPLDTGSASLPYGAWSATAPACGQPNMAVQLMTDVSASPVQVLWDNGPPDGTQRLNSQSGGQFTDYMTADDFELEEAELIIAVRSLHEEQTAFTWAGRVRVEIYPDNGSGSPDESGGATEAFWVPDDRGAVTRTSLGPGTFFTRYEYRLSELDIHLPVGSWWMVIAPAGSSPSGQTYWLTSRTLSSDGFLLGSQAHYRRPSAGVPNFTPWSGLLVGEQHDVSFVITVADERDCNCNSTFDYEELAGGADDCDGNLVLDDCEPDCNGNTVTDACDISGGGSRDCNGNLVPDECDILYQTSFDSDGDTVPNECDTCPGFDDTADADADTVPDGCDACPGFDDLLDDDSDAVPNDCDNCDLPNPGQEDCQPNGVGDVCDIADLTSVDCDQNGTPDECEAIPPPDIPAAAPDGIDLNRYLALLPMNPGRSTGIRVTLSSVHVPNPPNLPEYPAPDFSAFAGESRWVGPPTACPDTEGSFWCAKLQCAPHYEDWSTILGSSVLYITGSEVIPSSSYAGQTIVEGCTITNELAYSPPLLLRTARWGDTVAPFQEPSPAALTQPNVLEVSAMVDKVAEEAGALPKPRAQLKFNDPDPSEAVNVLEISYTVDAILGKAYPFSGPVSCP